MEEIKRLVYSRELRWNEIMIIAMRLFWENIKVIAAGTLVIGLPLSILLTLIPVSYTHLTLPTIA